MLKDSLADYEKFTSTFFYKDGIEEVLKRFLPINSQIEDLLGCTAGIACVRDSLELRILDNLDPNTRKISAYDAILASVSAQIYFQSQKVGNEVLVDAGCAVKSPSQVAFILASKYFSAEHQIEIFEIGTGKTPLSTLQHPQKLTRILNPSDSLWMVMDAGRNSTSAILNSLANGKNPLLKYHTIDFDLGDQVFLEKTTEEYFAKMSEVTKSFIQDNPQFESFIKSIYSSFLDEQPIIPEGLNLKDIPRDGHCLYSAISLYLGEDVAFLRNIVAAHLEENVGEYQDFFVNETLTPEEYIRRIRNTDEWGGELEIIILNKLLNRPIIVIGKNGKIINLPIIDPSYLNNESINPIFIFYNGVNHYSGLIPQEGYNPRIILDNLSKEHPNEQVEKFFSNIHQFTKETYKKFSAEYNKHNLLQASLPRLGKRIIEHSLDHVTSKFTQLQLRNVNNFAQSYKKYSKDLYPRAPEKFHNQETFGLPIVTANQESIEIPILSIDGGGTRGIWPLKVLEYIEKSTGKSISQIFTIKGGTSVGGLISLILSIPGSDGQPFYKAVDVANLLKDAEQIFPLGHYRKARNLLDPEKGVMFDNSGLRELLRRLIKNATGSEDLKMKDLIGTNIGVLSFDNNSLQPIFFSKTTHPEESVVELGVSTAAAPVYFPDNSLEFNGKTHKMGDGGIPDNNPVWYVYSMFNTAKQPGELAKILSLGTGMYLNDHPKRDEAPFWMAPAALLGFGMDSRTISQNSLMDIYSKTNISDISSFIRLQWDL
ncbi:MAG: patatin-like phospholipase family protein, partial [Gammaproteobacteria bacterium]